MAATSEAPNYMAPYANIRQRFAELPGSRDDDGLLLAPCLACRRGTASMDSADVIECTSGCSHGIITRELFAPRPPEPATNGRLRPRGVDLSRVEPFRWAWERWLLLGYFNLLVGDEGVGKGTFLAWLIARLTRGELPGDLRGEPARVLLIGDEDGFDNVVVPRAHAAGADLSRVFDLPVGDTGALEIARDAEQLAAIIAEHNVKVVIFDALLDNLGANVDDWRSAHVRPALAPARRIAAELDVCLLGSLHTNKSDAASFRQRMSGSQAFNALSRSSLWITHHPDDEDRRVLLRPKGNYSARPTTLAFAIDSAPLEINGHVHHPTRVVDVEQCGVTLEDVLGKVQPTSKTGQARDLITDELADGEWHDAAPIRAKLAELGLSEAGMKRAQHGLDIERRRTSGFPSRNQWRLSRAHAQGGPTGDPTYPTEPTVDSGLSRRSRHGENTPPRARAHTRGADILPLPSRPRSAIGADCLDDEGGGA